MCLCMFRTTWILRLCKILARLPSKIFNVMMREGTDGYVPLMLMGTYPTLQCTYPTLQCQKSVPIVGHARHVAACACRKISFSLKLKSASGPYMRPLRLQVGHLASMRAAQRA